eukprot:6830463-Lingulodinium_polyedra.AAC.1
MRSATDSDRALRYHVRAHKEPTELGGLCNLRPDPMRAVTISIQPTASLLQACQASLTSH